MESILDRLAHEHHMCDALFARACADMRRQDWDAAAQSVPALAAVLERHLRIEEDVIFDAVDAAPGANRQATAILRAEHRRVQGVLQRMQASQAAHEAGAFFKHADTLRVLLQYHHEKEELVFYPAAQRILQGQCDRIMAALPPLPSLSITCAVPPAAVPAGAA